MNEYVHAQLTQLPYLLAGVAFVTAALLRVHAGSGGQSTSEVLRRAGALTLQALPFALLMFLLFPRLPGPLWGIATGDDARTGLADEMTPGDISDLSVSGDVAFRVRFSGPLPPPAQRYWRGPVLHEFDGRSWRRPRAQSFPEQAVAYLGEPVDYQITLLPTDRPWITALDIPAAWPGREAYRSYDFQQAGKTRRLLRPGPAPVTRFERDHVNALWQSDASHGPWLPDPARPGQMRRTHLTPCPTRRVRVAFLDDHSRLIPYGEFFFEEALPRLERVLKVALLRRGVPDALYVDNGQIFNATQFRAACATLRIEVIFASPYHPQGKGKIEQFWHRVQEAFYPEVAASQITDLATLNRSFWAWLHGVYHARVHGETGQSPLDRFLAGAEHLRAADPETLRLAFQWRTKRTVTRQATLNLQGNVYHVDPAWCGQVIELRYDPFDLSHMDVYRAGVRLGTAQNP